VEADRAKRGEFSRHPGVQRRRLHDIGPRDGDGDRAGCTDEKDKGKGKNKDKLGKCYLWVAAAGGGVWRTDNPLSKEPSWKYLSEEFASNAIGALTYDAANGVLYAGTGEPNASGDSEAGIGVYKVDGQRQHVDEARLLGHVADDYLLRSEQCRGRVRGAGFQRDVYGDAFAGRSISSIVVDPTNPNVLYVSSTRGVRGVSSVTGGATSNPPLARPPYGLFKSTDGGATFALVWDGNASVRGVNHVELDPSSNTTVYAAAFQQGVWRSTNGGNDLHSDQDTRCAGRKHGSRGICRDQAAERQDPDVYRRWLDCRHPRGRGRNFSVPMTQQPQCQPSPISRPARIRITVPVSAVRQSGPYPPGYPDVVYLGGSYG
jgi:hypothetical protein